jgi:HTH-type transcriptional regulator / antitoxin HipB
VQTVADGVPRMPRPRADAAAISRSAISAFYRHHRLFHFIALGDILAISAVAINRLAAPIMNQLLSVPSQVGLVLRAARKAAKLSQKELAAKLGLSQNRLSELETDPGSMRVEQLLAVLAALGLELQVQARGGVSAGDGTGATGKPAGDEVEW